MEIKPYVINHYYDKKTCTCWEVWSDGKAFADSMDVALRRNSRGTWYTETTYQKLYNAQIDQEIKSRGFCTFVLHTPSGAWNVDETSILSGVEKIYSDYIRLLIEE